MREGKISRIIALGAVSLSLVACGSEQIETKNDNVDSKENKENLQNDSKDDFYVNDLDMLVTDGTDKWKIIADSMDVNGDEVDDTVCFEAYKDDTDNSLEHFCIHINDIDISLDDVEFPFGNPESPIDFGYYKVKLVHSSTGNYAFVEYSEDKEHGDSISIYDIDNNGRFIQKINSGEDKAFTGIKVRSISDDEAEIEYQINLFGTWNVTRKEKYDSNGIAPCTSLFNFDENGTKLDYIADTTEYITELTLKRDLEYKDKDGKVAVLPKGEKVIFKTLEGNTIGFVNGDGSVSGSFTYDAKNDYLFFVNGIREDDLFEGMHYLG